jgi:hypothetical protein
MWAPRIDGDLAMWIELLKGLSERYEFQTGATWSSLEIAQEKLNVKLPTELRELLQESDGVLVEYGCDFIWSVDRIISENIDIRRCKSSREIYMPFDHLLFFGDLGNGDQFAFPIRANGEIARSEIFGWNHEDDSRTSIAPSLKTFFEWSETGKIKF